MLGREMGKPSEAFLCLMTFYVLKSAAKMSLGFILFAIFPTDSGPGKLLLYLCLWSSLAAWPPVPNPKCDLQHQKYKRSPLVGVAQLVECCPEHQKVTRSIPSLGTLPGCGLHPPVGG